MEAPWLPTILGISEDVLHQCVMIYDLVRDVFIDQVLKGLPSQHLPFWLYKDMLHQIFISLPQSCRQSIIYTYELP